MATEINNANNPEAQKPSEDSLTRDKDIEISNIHVSDGKTPTLMLCPRNFIAMYSLQFF